MDALTDVGSLSFITLPRLGTLVFGTKGVTKISAIRISDTYLSDLSGLSVASVDSFQIDNNRKITAFNSDLVNVTKELLIFDNGNNMDITMNKLELAAEVQISNAKNFEVPALERVTKSLKFTSNPELKSLTFPNLTKVSETISFVDMNKLTNISFPVLETIGGGLAIENNTKLLAIDDLPKLKTVYGGISLRGNFEKVELPKLDTVSGTVVVTSTTDIKEFCQFFKDLKDDGKIEGKEDCTWNNPEANKGGEGGESDTKSGSSSDSKDEEDAAGILNVNMASLAVVGLFAVAQVL
ncbi:cell wall protein Ecm33, variant 2 [Fusarium solani]